MKIRLLTLSLLSALVVLPVLRAQDDDMKKMDPKEPQTELTGKMEKLSDAYRKLGREIKDASKNEDSLQQVAIIKEMAGAALTLQPDKTKILPDADQAKFVDDFHAKMKEFIATVDQLDAALKANDNETAAKLVDDMKTMRNDDHKVFQKEKKKKGKMAEKA